MFLLVYFQGNYIHLGSFALYTEQSVKILTFTHDLAFCANMLDLKY